MIIKLSLKKASSKTLRRLLKVPKFLKEPSNSPCRCLPPSNLERKKFQLKSGWRN